MTKTQSTRYAILELMQQGTVYHGTPPEIVFTGATDNDTAFLRALQQANEEADAAAKAAFQVAYTNRLAVIAKNYGLPAVAF